MRSTLYLLMLVCLGGCAGPMTQYYVLNTISPDNINAAAQSSQQKPAAQARIQTPDVHGLEGQQIADQQIAVQQIAIRQLEIPRYLDRPRIVSRDADNHLRISEYHQWGGRLRDDLIRTLSDNLAERLPSITVHTAPFPGSMHADISLVIDIRQFELLADGRMHLKVRWHVQRSGQKAGKHALSYFDHMIGENRVSEKDYAGMAAAMSKILALLSEKIVSVIMHLPDVETK